MGAVPDGGKVAPGRPRKFRCPYLWRPAQYPYPWEPHSPLQEILTEGKTWDFFVSIRRTLRGVAEAALKNFYTLWRYSKKFKFLKEVKILSKFLRNKLACLITAVQITKKLTGTLAISRVALYSFRGTERWTSPRGRVWRIDSREVSSKASKATNRTLIWI